MRISWKLITIVVAVIFGITALFIFSKYKSDQNQKRQLVSELETVILQNKSGEISIIELSKITKFPWETLYIFGPYTSPDKIDSIIGRYWLGSRFISIESNDSVTLLVFTRNGRVVQNIEFPRAIGDFSAVDNNLGYSSAEARFKVVEKEKLIWLGN